MPRVATFCPRCGESIETELPEEARTAGRAELACPSCKFRFVIAPASGAGPSESEQGEGAADEESGASHDPTPEAESSAPSPEAGEEGPPASTRFPQASDARVTPKKQRSGALPARLLSASLLLFFAAALGIFNGFIFANAPGLFDEALTGPEMSAELSGVVYDPGRSPLEGVTVELLESVEEGERPDRNTPAHRSTETDSEGRYEFVGIAPGTKWLRVQEPGFQTTFLETVAFQEGDEPAVGDSAAFGEITLTRGEAEELDYQSHATLFDTMLRVFEVWGWIAIPAGLLAVVAGVLVLVRRGFAFVIAGAIAGMISFGLLIGAVMALVALILVLTARHEFLPFRKKPEAPERS